MTKGVQFEECQKAPPGTVKGNSFLQVSAYLKREVLPILEPLQHDILKHHPQDIEAFAVMWLQMYKENNRRPQISAFQKQEGQKEESDVDDEMPDETFRAKIANKRNRKGFRAGVSGECTPSSNAPYRENSPKNVPSNSCDHSPNPQRTVMSFERTEQAKIKILIELRNSILFKNMTHSSLLKIIDQMRQAEYQEGETVIRQGEDGNQLFIVDEGLFKCYLPNSKQQESGERFRLYGPGEAFGELALLYNTKRASTIVAEQKGKLFCLQRKIFNAILRENVLRKTQMCEQILNSVEIFRSLDRYEKSKLYEALQEVEIASGKYVIKEGQIGDCFYIVAEGKLVAEKFNPESEEVDPVYYYKENDYFGELAIMKDQYRQASIKALTRCRLLYIDRNSFKRLLGSIESILKRNESRYRDRQRKKTGRRENQVYKAPQSDYLSQD